MTLRIQPGDNMQPLPPRSKGPWLRQVDGLHVLKVQGSFYEMGRQHGELLREPMRQGPLPYFRRYFEKMLRGAAPAPVARLAWPLLQRSLGRRIAAALPEFAEQTLTGMADGADLPLDEVLAGATMPDALLWVVARLMRVRRIGPAVHHRFALGLGCTSAIAWGDATSDGSLLHARNFDYHGVESWPNTAAVIFHEPERGQRYVAVGAAGVPLGGITAMNEAGLTLTVHQHMFTDRAKLGGTPIGLVGDCVMREAESLDDAVKILGAHTPIGCWTYLVTDGRRREMLCWEENPERRAHRRIGTGRGSDESHFGYANIYLDDQLGATEKNLYGSYWRHNHGRHTRVNQLLSERAGGIDAEVMASILGDTGEGECRISRAIAMVMTVGSVVFRPEDGVLWVGSGQAPTSHRPFIPFDLNSESHAPRHRQLTSGTPDDPAAAAAFERYRQSYISYVDHDDVQRSRELIEEACALQDEQALYHVLAGLLALQTGDAQRAMTAFSRALELGHDDEQRLACFHLWHGRAADMAGRRELATKHYRRSLGHNADTPVYRAARQGLDKPYRSRQAQRMTVDFTYADVVQP
jgi:tetratricopeptide (TPR) repeat protein